MSALDRFRSTSEKMRRAVVWRLKRLFYPLALRILSRDRKGAALAVPLYADVGAAGGFSHEWALAAKNGLVKLLGFEPDIDAFRALVARNDSRTYLPFALADKDGEQTFHLTKHPECSSCLMPDLEILERFPAGKNFQVRSTVKLSARAAASLIRSGEMPVPQFLKLDVQGFEHAVLTGFGDYLSQVVAIELESHLPTIYVGEKGIAELVTLLATRGFEMRNIVPYGPFEGAAIEFNLWFSRRLNLLTSDEKKMLELWEIACFISHRSGDHFEAMLPNHTAQDKAAF